MTNTPKNAAHASVPPAPISSAGSAPASVRDLYVPPLDASRVLADEEFLRAAHDARGERDG